MSRIGKRPIDVPKNVTVTIESNNHVKVKGPKGELMRAFHPEMKLSMDGSVITVERPSEEQKHKALHGLSRTLMANMVDGVSTGFTKTLELIGVGYKAEVRPYGLQLALGFSHPIEYRAPQGIKLSAPQPTQIIVEGADKEIVGQVAAELRAFRPPEPYKGKGVKYQGEQVRRKAGKAGSK
ncbi:MAG TPA: 50S ribosomal protein L6 [Gemmatimonadaceae bacterium]|jgi:large subunit ribosomal protein L6|nr:50S ribosomal protein L6 [Gemmatimonadaceae bacterium]